MSCDEISRKSYCDNGPCRVSIDRTFVNLRLRTGRIPVSRPVDQISLTKILDPLIYSTTETTSLIVIGIRDECLAC